MAARVTVKVKVYRSKIEAMNAPGGMVDRYVRGISEQITASAVAYAPRRSGDLKASIHGDRAGSTGTTVNYRVHADADYAHYVHEGTNPISTSHDMRLYTKPPRTPPARWAGYYGARTRYVRGQAANPFLTKAMHSVLAAHGL